MITLAMFDLPTQSASGFIIRYVLPRTGPPQLIGPLVRRKPFSMLTFGDIIIGTGHGDPDAFTGQNEAVLLEVGKYNPKEVEGKVIKLISCQTGLELGPDLVKNGALSFAGYCDDYVWVMDADLSSTPWADKMAAACLMPVIDGLNILLDGETAQTAFDTELAGYSKNAEAEEDELIKSCIEFNRKNAVLLGDSSARIRARPKIKFPIPPPPLPPTALLPFMLLSLLTGPLPP